MQTIAELAGSAPAWGAVLLAYLLGSIPFGFVLGRVFKGVDIREAGSRNIGATNAGRVLGRPFGLVAFAGDFGKGWAATWGLGPALAPSPASASLLSVLCGAAAVLGHVFPLYLRFRGGKAVATGCGAIVGVDPWVFLGGGAAWLVTLLAFRYVGLASMVMALAFPVVAAWRAGSQPYGWDFVAGTAALAALVLWRHRANISRMRAGTEPKLGQSSSASAASSGREPENA